MFLIGSPRLLCLFHQWHRHRHHPIHGLNRLPRFCQKLVIDRSACVSAYVIDHSFWCYTKFRYDLMMKKRQIGSLSY